MNIDQQITTALGFPKPQYVSVERERRWLCRAVPRERVVQTEARQLLERLWQFGQRRVAIVSIPLAQKICQATGFAGASSLMARLRAFR